MGQKGGDGSGEGGGKDERGREGGRMEGERGTSVCTVTSEITIHINLSQEFFDEHDLWIKKTTQSCILALISHTHIFICVIFFRFDIFPVSKY